MAEQSNLSPDPDAAGELAPTTSPDTARPARTGGPGWPALLVAASLGVVLAWGLLLACEDFFKMRSLVTISEETQRKIDSGELDGGAVMGAIMRENDLGELARKASEETPAVALKNNTLALAVLGLAVCGLFGLTLGIARKSTGDALVGLLLGSILGAILGAGGAQAGTFVEGRLKPMQFVAPEIQTVLMHATTWISVGIAVGATIGFHSRRPRALVRAVVAGMLGGALAACLYSPTAALLFPLDQAELLVPAGNANRLYWIGLFVLTTAAVVQYENVRSPKRARVARVPQQSDGSSE